MNSPIVPAGQKPDGSTPAFVELAVQAQLAELKAKILVARQFPRDLRRIRTTLVEYCRDFYFADMARYALPRGRDETGKERVLSGASVHFARVAITLLGNMEEETMLVAEEPLYRVMRVRVVDLETNTHRKEDVVVSKTIERHYLPDGVVPIGPVRETSKGRKLYTFPASENEILQQQHSLCARVSRNLALSFLPESIQQECFAVCDETIAKEEEKSSPEEQAKRVIASMGQVGITAEMVRKYLGSNHDLRAFTDQERSQLRNLKNAIVDGLTTFAQALATRENAAAAKQLPDGSSTDRLEQLVQNRAETVATTP